MRHVVLTFANSVHLSTMLANVSLAFWFIVDTPYALTVSSNFIIKTAFDAQSVANLLKI